MFVLFLFLSVVYLFSSLSYLYSYLHSFFHVDNAEGNTRCASPSEECCTWRYTILPHEFKTNDWSRNVHRVDASACRSIMLRRGCGGLKHITVKSLWVQEAVREYSIEIERISREEMQAHILVSPSSAEELRKHLTELNAFRKLAEEAER